MGVNPNQIINYKIDPIEETALGLNAAKKFDFVIDLVGNAISDIVAKLLKTNGTYVDVTALLTQNSREILFGKGATILNISNYAYSVEKRYDYYKNGLEQLADLLEKELIKPPVINIIGQLEVATIKIAHQMLRENKTEGKKLIMKVN
jgi:NADPH:quinone reductase-like Zn-dependent oxidoreductase